MTALVDETRRVELAVRIADHLLREAERRISKPERRRQERLAKLVDDQRGRRLLQHLTDEVLRIDRPRRAAARFQAIVREVGAPSSLGWWDRAQLRSGAMLAGALPGVVMPLVRRRILGETRGLIIPADNASLTKHLARRRASGMDVNINVLGEAIHSDAEAEQRVARVVTTMLRPDVSYMSVKISSICAQLDVVAFDDGVARIRTALERIYDAAVVSRVFVNLDMEEYADLHLTVEAFLATIDIERFRSMSAGIVLQAYLPDSHAVLARLIEASAARVAGGGAPLRVRLVKGANLAMEQVDAELHGWVRAPYATKAEVDASYKRLLDAALTAAASGALRVGVGSHNLFDIGWALALRHDLPAGRGEAVEIEMLEGMVPAQARATRDAAGSLLLYCPVVDDDEVEASLAYLARRFDENTGPENFLRAMFSMTPGSHRFEVEAERFRRSVAERRLVGIEPRRPAVAPVASPPGGFANIADSDFTAAAVRDTIAEAMAFPPDVHVPLTTVASEVDEVVRRAASGAQRWAGLSAAERRAMLEATAARMAEQRPATLGLMADESGKTVREGDPEVSEAIDFARYYASLPEEPGSAPLGTVLVTAPWNFPYSIPAGGVFAALAAGNSVILKPAPETVRTGRWLVEQCWAAGIPDDVVQYVACPDDEVGQHLVTHPGIATVVLTGSYDTAQMFLGWKPSLRLLAETSGKNAIVVTEAADEDHAIADVIRSAFGHAGQKCSAASLLILDARLYDGETFLERLAAAVRTMRVGWASDPATVVGPLIGPPGDNLRRALTSLDDGERWLVEPEQVGSDERMWTPGVRLGVARGSWFHQTECFGPVLGVMRAESLDEAIELQNGTPFGLTGGLESLDPDEIGRWLDRVQVGNAYVNRHITGAVVRRQAFGGWKRSAVGGGPKAGGPDYVNALRSVPAEPIDGAAASESYRRAWATRFGIDSDLSALTSESNIHRYRPLHRELVRVGPDTPSGVVEAARAAAATTGTEMVLVDAGQVDDAALSASLATESADRVRLLTSMVSDELLAAFHRAGVAVDRQPVSPNGNLELPHWLTEQSLSVTRHRYGRILDR